MRDSDPKNSRDDSRPVEGNRVFAHELLTMLMVVRGYLGRAGREAAHMKDPTAMLEICQRACDRAFHLVTHWLAGDTAVLGERQVVPLRVVVAGVVQMLRGLAPANVRLDWRPGRSVHALVDRLKIESVLLNLGTNACRAMSAGPGTLRVTLDVQAPTIGHAEDDAANLGSWSAIIGVSDTGIGMDGATVERAFERGFTTGSDEQRMGLGLWLAREIVLAHGGRMHVDSTPRVGTTVFVELPCFRPDDVGVENLSGIAAPEGPHVLCVDDQAWLLGLLRELLEQAGYRVTAASEPYVALARFRAAPHDFSIVIADQRMPAMTGLDLIQHLRTIRHDIPCLLTSAMITEELEQGALRAGVSRIVFKPAIAVELLSILDDVLSRKPS
jgi:CheY-like chemotaxis protein